MISESAPLVTYKPVVIGTHFNLEHDDHIEVTVRWRYESEGTSPYRIARKKFPTPTWTIRNILRDQIDTGGYTSWPS